MVAVPNPIDIDQAEFTRMYNATVQVLRDHGFRIDRHSHRFGVVTTRYQDSPIFFEPWQTANSTTSQSWESTLNDQRRWVVLSLEPYDTPPPAAVPGTTTDPTTPTGYRMRLEVFVERHQRPTVFLSGSTNGHRIFSALRSTPAELSERGIEDEYWRPIGRDLYLEQRLLADIVRRSMNIPVSSPVTTNTQSTG